MKGVLPASKGGEGEGTEWERVGGSFGGWARSNALTNLFLARPDAEGAGQNCQRYKTITMQEEPTMQNDNQRTEFYDWGRILLAWMSSFGNKRDASNP